MRHGRAVSREPIGEYVVAPPLFAGALRLLQNLAAG